MLQIIPKISLLNIGKEMNDPISKIKLRGYNSGQPVGVTSGLYNQIVDGTIKPLSISDITSIHCTSRRDIYLKKILRTKDKDSWGKITGNFVESCICEFAEKYVSNKQVNKLRKYETIMKKSSLYIDEFLKRKKSKILELSQYKSSPEEDENWLFRQLDYALRHELLMLFTSNKLSLAKKNTDDPTQRIEIKPNSKVIGISSPSTPDFILPSFSAIGDIKTGPEFKDYFRLTAAGYALAYENQYGKDHDINIGIIYYFPTRKKDISFAHVYIFIIDDALRKEFLRKRDEALIVMRDANLRPPIIPKIMEKEKCIYCKYISECDKQRYTNEENTSAN